MSETSDQTQPFRAPYDPPRVEVVGTLQELTLGAGGNLFDVNLSAATL